MLWQMPLTHHLPRIGGRLAGAFAVISLLMLAGYGIGVWQFELLRSRFEYLSQEDQKQLAVLRVHTDVLEFPDRMESLLGSQSARDLAGILETLQNGFAEDIDRAKRALRASSNEPTRSRLLITLEAVQSTFARQTSTLDDLIRAGDLEALRLRVSSQVNALRPITGAAVREVDSEVEREQAEALKGIAELQRRILLIFPLTAALTLITAGTLGFLVTRSITRPLGSLDEAARALGRGELDRRITVSGADELAILGHAFNYAAERLQQSYAELKAAHDMVTGELNERVRAEREIHALNERLISAQESERARIARELHDDLSQQVAALSISASNLKQTLPLQEAEGREQIERFRQKLAQLADSIRHLSHQLHPAILEHAGLGAALRSYCAEFSQLSGIKVSCNAGGAFADLSPEAALCIYRVTQEALQNVSKHSGAQNAVVSLSRESQRVCLTISDRGSGCVDVGPSKGLGLISMKERVRLIDGSFEFESSPGCGTTVRVFVPVG